MTQKYREKNRKKMFLKTYIIFRKVDTERVLNSFDSKKFPIKIEGAGFSDKVSNHPNLKIWTPTQMIQRLPIAPAQVKAGNISKSLQNKIRKIKYSLSWASEITKKVFYNMMNSIKE